MPREGSRAAYEFHQKASRSPVAPGSLPKPLFPDSAQLLRRLTLQGRVFLLPFGQSHEGVNYLATVRLEDHFAGLHKMKLHMMKHVTGPGGLVRGRREGKVAP